MSKQKKRGFFVKTVEKLNNSYEKSLEKNDPIYLEPLHKTEEGEKELLAVEDNRKRAYHLELEGKYKKLTLIPLSSWGETEEIPIVSFDFN